MATLETAICETCKKEFSFYRSTLRGKDARFCSRGCIKIIPYNKGNIELHKCLGCEKQIRKWKKYCTHKCYIDHVEVRSHLPKDLSGKNNPSWRGGITETVRLERNRFGKTMVKIVLERDNYTCQICKKRGKRLHVDHIQPWAEYVEGRFDINNCRTLCLDCHYLITWGKIRPEKNTWGTRKYFNLEGI